MLRNKNHFPSCFLGQISDLSSHAQPRVYNFTSLVPLYKRQKLYFAVFLGDAIKFVQFHQGLFCKQLEISMRSQADQKKIRGKTSRLDFLVSAAKERKKNVSPHAGSVAVISGLVISHQLPPEVMVKMLRLACRKMSNRGAYYKNLYGGRR